MATPAFFIWARFPPWVRRPRGLQFHKGCSGRCLVSPSQRCIRSGPSLFGVGPSAGNDGYRKKEVHQKKESWCERDISAAQRRGGKAFPAAAGSTAGECAWVLCRLVCKLRMRCPNRRDECRIKD